MQYQPPDKSFCYQAYSRVDEEAERLQAKSETTGSRKTSPEIIDVDATPAKTSTATKEDKEATSGGEKDDSSKKDGSLHASHRPIKIPNEASSP